MQTRHKSAIIPKARSPAAMPSSRVRDSAIKSTSRPSSPSDDFEIITAAPSVTQNEGTSSSTPSVAPPRNFPTDKGFAVMMHHTFPDPLTYSPNSENFVPPHSPTHPIEPRVHPAQLDHASLPPGMNRAFLQYPLFHVHHTPDTSRAYAAQLSYIKTECAGSPLLPNQAGFERLVRYMKTLGSLLGLLPYFLGQIAFERHPYSIRHPDIPTAIHEATIATLDDLAMQWAPPTPSDTIYLDHPARYYLPVIKSIRSYLSPGNLQRYSKL
jgi:hypothetical protein